MSLVQEVYVFGMFVHDLIEESMLHEFPRQEHYAIWRKYTKLSRY